MAQLKQTKQEDTKSEDICLFAQTNFRNQLRRFGIKTDDRRRHMYVIGKTGMGKTTMLENMVLQDIYKGHGIGVVDPHGDFAEKIIDYIPQNRINDVVYVNPADSAFPIGFNILEVKNEEQKHLIAAGLMATFKKIWPDVWSSRMEYILNNTLLALLDYPGSTLLGINRLLGDKKYRKRVVKKLTDPVIKAFWQNEFANYPDRYMTEAVAPIQNKIGQFLSASIIRNMVAQVKSTIDIRDIMDSGKIFIMNLSKGRIGEDNSRLLGGMLITKIQLSAMERVDTPEDERKDFFLYVDEFQNFATPSFANILSEARKYRLSLIMAHQYVAQLDEVVADAVFGNVGTIVTFRVGGADAELLVKEFDPHFLEPDIVNLAKYYILLKLMIDGVASQPFSAITMPPIGSPTGVSDKIKRVSRERYSCSRKDVEDKIARWSSNDDEEENNNNNNNDNKPKVLSPVSSNQQNKNSESKLNKKPQNRKQDIPKKIDELSSIKNNHKNIDTPKREKTISLNSLKPEESKKQDNIKQNNMTVSHGLNEPQKETKSQKKRHRKNKKKNEQSGQQQSQNIIVDNTEKKSDSIIHSAKKEEQLVSKNMQKSPTVLAEDVVVKFDSDNNFDADK